MFAKWCQTAYCDGVRELYESRKSKSKFTFWSITIIIMIGFTAYFVGKVAINYIDSPTVTTISTMPFTEKDLPEILLCFNGGLNVSALLHENFSTDLIFTVSGLLPMGTLNLTDSARTKIELDTYLSKNQFDMMQFYEKFSYDCEDMVQFVHKAGTNEDIGCKNFTVMISSVYGRCLLYEDTGQQKSPGLNVGVRLRLKMPKDSFVERFPLEALKLDKTLSYAISIEDDFVTQTERFILAPINMKTEISLNAKQFQRLPEGVTHCNLSSTDPHSNVCFGHCYADAVYETCGCVPAKYKDTMKDITVRKLKICTPFEEYSCMAFENKSSMCEKTCSPKCEEWIYDRDVSYGSLTTKQPMASVWIGYNTMQYTQVHY